MFNQHPQIIDLYGGITSAAMLRQMRARQVNQARAAKVDPNQPRHVDRGQAWQAHRVQTQQRQMSCDYVSIKMDVQTFNLHSQWSNLNVSMLCRWTLFKLTTVSKDPKVIKSGRCHMSLHTAVWNVYKILNLNSSPVNVITPYQSKLML